jgi:hypothetical protein
VTFISPSGLKSHLLRIYILCLLACVGAVKAAQANWSVPVKSVEDQRLEVAIAVPPKPDGARDLTTGREGQASIYDENACRALGGDFRDVCFHAVARRRAERDLSGALLACAEIDRQRLHFECLADVAEMHVWTDLAAARSVCPQIPRRKWHDQCYFGIAMALSQRAPDAALAGCDDAGIWRDFCRHDVVGEVSKQDVEWSLAVCAAETGDLLRRKTCWHGIGKYVARVDADRGFAACARVPLGPENLYRENCIHGVGWALSESAGAGAVNSCTQKAGANLDSCLLGVAFNLKRLDPDSAAQICSSVKRADLRADCGAFLKR